MSLPEMRNGCSSELPSYEDEKKRSHFFQIIHPHIIENRRVELPRTFVINFGKELSEVAVIMVPGGKLWHVELRKAEGEISFQNGWQEFMDYYSICVGQFLVFRYDGNSCFHVLIFDLSRSEIEYEDPCHKEDSKEHNNERAKSKSCIQSENPSFYSKEEPEMILIPSDSESDDDPTMSTPIQFASRRGRAAWCSMMKVGNRPESSRVGFSAPHVNRRNEREASAKALRAARKFKSENPFCRITMHQSYVSEKFILHVPVSLAKYLIWDTQSITLRVSDEKTWKIQRITSGGRTKLIKGWKEFVVDNQLEEGDVCVFELVDKSIKVYIFRAS